jgi:Mn-containing catalase
LKRIDEPTPAIDGGDGKASVSLDSKQQAAVEAMKDRLKSDLSSDPQTGAELGMSKPKRSRT